MQRATAVSKFLEDLFTVSNPDESQGKTITAREMLDKGAKTIDQGLADQPGLRADLKETMGRVYRNQGFAKQAKPLLEEALRLRREEFGDDDLRVVSPLQNLVNVFRELDKNDAAEPLIREALDIQRGAMPPGRRGIFARPSRSRMSISRWIIPTGPSTCETSPPCS